jgi:serine/threonine protein phosphatase PrpC
MTDESNSVLRWSTMSLVPGPFDSPPPSVKAGVEFGAQSRPGRGRSAPDDHYLILRLERRLETLLTSLPTTDVLAPFAEYGHGMFLAHGLGHDADYASRLSITTLVNLALSFGKWNLRINEPIADEVMDRVERFYRSIDLELLKAGRQSPVGLQTTLTAVVTAGKELFFAHVGHSRAYLFRDGELMQLTRDHTGPGEVLDETVPVDVGARPRDMHHTLTETIGRRGAGGLRIDVERCGLLDRDAVLLCTNGLTDLIDDAVIANVLRRHDTPDSRCRTLVDLAVEAGGNDDATALLAQYRIEA